MNKKISVFKSAASNSQIILNYSPYVESGDGWVRLTEWLDVDLIDLPVDVIIEKQLDGLATAESALRNEFQVKLNEIIEQRSKLLALTHK